MCCGGQNHDPGWVLLRQEASEGADRALPTSARFGHRTCTARVLQDARPPSASQRVSVLSAMHVTVNSASTLSIGDAQARSALNTMALSSKRAPGVCTSEIKKLPHTWLRSFGSSAAANAWWPTWLVPHCVSKPSFVNSRGHICGRTGMPHEYVRRVSLVCPSEAGMHGAVQEAQEHDAGGLVPSSAAPPPAAGIAAAARGCTCCHS